MKKLVFLILTLLTNSCVKQPSVPIPKQILELEQLSIYSTAIKPTETISFHREVVYGDSDELMIGWLGDVVVDTQGRVFLADNRALVIYAFEAGGLLLDHFGGAGAGPGEFSWRVHNLQIHNNYLYALDANRHRLHIFSLDNLSVETTLSLAENRINYPELARAFPYIDNLYIRKDGAYIAEFIMNASQERFEPYGSREMLVYYFLMDENGSLSRNLFDFIRETRSNSEIDTQLFRPFNGKVISAFPSSNRIHLAEPANFLVKTYSTAGVYQSAFYYPIPKIPLTKELAIEAKVPDRYIDSMELLLHLPESWPVVTDMKLDDKDRFWISTTVEDMSIYEWWVLEENGELITRFEWPRDEPIEVVKNGYMYTRETEKETGLQHIVRYRIEMQEV